MSIVTVFPQGKMIGVSAHTSLLAALLGADLVIPHKCEGKGECGSCQILVRSGSSGLSKMRRSENERLKKMEGIDPKSRLACQAKVLGTRNMVVDLQGVAQPL
ncbi:2Fe-2S iron-sulfur cluster-binding protein [Bradyrhizobium sp. STM 3562]|uniref:2Fe-2S iron-sulfur cluster-binding protein n=1 Tax=Bradyrhizobium sp. STM 3562 TaxID=578924 RepID=UPI003890DF40